MLQYYQWKHCVTCIGTLVNNNNKSRRDLRHVLFDQPNSNSIHPWEVSCNNNFMHIFKSWINRGNVVFWSLTNPFLLPDPTWLSRTGRRRRRRRAPSSSSPPRTPAASARPPSGPPHHPDQTQTGQTAFENIFIQNKKQTFKRKKISLLCDRLLLFNLYNILCLCNL